MKVGLISEAPALTTGFGQTSRQIASGLVDKGHTVVCFGIGVSGEVFDRDAYPYKIWAVGKQNLISQLSDFLSFEKPDVIFINFDLVAIERWYSVIRDTLKWKGRVLAYFVVDGLPIDHSFLKSLKEIGCALTPTNVVANYLRSVGFENISVAPLGVDRNIYRPLDNRHELRKRINLENKFVVGVFGRNNERKQHPRVLMAIKNLVNDEQLDDLVLYLHCQPIDDVRLGGWDLQEIANRLKINHVCYFPEKNFVNVMGVPVSREKSGGESLGTQGIFPTDYTYVERLNCCDLIINPSFCGGFELSIIEAQACGVPVASTNDNGIMREVCGDGAILLDPSDFGIWRTGAYQFHVAPSTIAEAIKQVKNNTAYREELIQRGFENVQKYSWDILKEKSCQMVENITLC